MALGYWAAVHEVATIPHTLEPGLEYVSFYRRNNPTSVHCVGKDALILFRSAQSDRKVDVHIIATIKSLFGDHIEVDRVVNDAHGEVIEVLWVVFAPARVDSYTRLH